MTYGEIYEKAVKVIGRENVSDYRPAVYEGRLNGMFDVPLAGCVPNAIMIWLKNGDRIVYRAMEKGEWRGEHMEFARLLDDTEKERKRDKMRRSATELHQYYRELMEAGFTKKQAMKIVVAVAGRDRR